MQILKFPIPCQEGRPKAKLSLGKGGGKGSEPSQTSFLGKKDLFNLSNDEFYNPRHVSSTQGLSGLVSSVVQHSLPALDLHCLWFPTHLSLHTLRHYHRPRLRLRCDSRRGSTGPLTVEGLVGHIALKNKVSTPPILLMLVLMYIVGMQILMWVLCHRRMLH